MQFSTRLRRYKTANRSLAVLTKTSMSIVYATLKDDIPELLTLMFDNEKQ